MLWHFWKIRCLPQGALPLETPVAFFVKKQRKKLYILIMHSTPSETFGIFVF